MILEQGVPHEGDDVEDRVRHDQRHDPFGALVEPAEDQAHDEVADEPAEALVEVIRPADRRTGHDAGQSPSSDRAGGSAGRRS